MYEIKTIFNEGFLEKHRLTSLLVIMAVLLGAIGGSFVWLSPRQVFLIVLVFLTFIGLFFTLNSIVIWKFLKGNYNSNYHSSPFADSPKLIVRGMASHFRIFFIANNFLWGLCCSIFLIFLFILLKVSTFYILAFFTGGSLAVIFLSFLGSPFIIPYQSDMLGVCWHVPIANGTLKFWDRVGTSVILKKRYECAKEFDLANPRNSEPALDTIGRIHELAMEGKEEKNPLDLINTMNDPKKEFKNENCCRARVFGCIFLIAGLLAAMLSLLGMNKYQPFQLPEGRSVVAKKNSTEDKVDAPKKKNPREDKKNSKEDCDSKKPSPGGKKPGEKKKQDKQRKGKSGEGNQDKQRKGKSGEGSQDKQRKGKSGEGSQDKQRKGKSGEGNQDKQRKGKSGEGNQEKQRKGKSGEGNQDKQRKGKPGEGNQDKQRKGKPGEGNQDKQRKGKPEKGNQDSREKCQPGKKNQDKKKNGKPGPGKSNGDQRSNVKMINGKEKVEGKAIRGIVKSCAWKAIKVKSKPGEKTGKDVKKGSVDGIKSSPGSLKEKPKSRSNPVPLPSLPRGTTPPVMIKVPPVTDREPGTNKTNTEKISNQKRKPKMKRRSQLSLPKKKNKKYNRSHSPEQYLPNWILHLLKKKKK
jgi:hypothetical protein